MRELEGGTAKNLEVYNLICAEKWKAEQERDQLKRERDELLNQNHKVWGILNGAGLCGSTDEEVKEQLLLYAAADARVDKMVEECDAIYRQGFEDCREAFDKLLDTIGGWLHLPTVKELARKVRALPVPERGKEAQ